MKRVRDVAGLDSGAAAEPVAGLHFCDLVQDMHEQLMVTYLSTTAAYFLSRTCRAFATLFDALVEQRRVGNDGFETGRVRLEAVDLALPIVHPMLFIAHGYENLVNIWKVDNVAEDINPYRLVALDNIPKKKLFDVIWRYQRDEDPNMPLSEFGRRATVANFKWIMELPQFREKIFGDDLNRDPFEYQDSIADVLFNAVSGNNLALVKFVCDMVLLSLPRIPQRTMKRLKKLALNAFDTLMFFFSLEPAIPDGFESHLIRRTRDLRVVKWAYSSKKMALSGLLKNAIENDNDDIVAFALQNGIDAETVKQTRATSFLRSAAQLEDTAILSLLLNYGHTWKPMLFDEVAMTLDSFIHLVKCGCRPFRDEFDVCKFIAGLVHQAKFDSALEFALKHGLITNRALLLKELLNAISGIALSTASLAYLCNM